MAEPDYSLAWPRQLFEWEARRVVALYPSDKMVQTIEQLLSEAFEDEDVAQDFLQTAGASAIAHSIWMSESAEDLVAQAEERSRDWLLELLHDDARLHDRLAPVYYAERTGALGNLDAVLPNLSFAYDFVQFIWDYMNFGYFPKVLPKECVDGAETDDATVTKKIRSAIKQAVTWPIFPSKADELSQSVLYSLVEYFHDQAQRPRSFYVHSYAECGKHYEGHNRESGGAVYRWRVNEMLAARGIPLRLASNGPERGRLIRYFDSPLDELVREQMTERGPDPEDQVAHAIRQYRARGASKTSKRAALASLAHEIEPLRKAMKANLVKKDEAYLFEIANNFRIRHNDAGQSDDYGAEFLDWMFWNFLSMIQLMTALDARPATPPAKAETPGRDRGGHWPGQ